MPLDDFKSGQQQRGYRLFADATDRDGDSTTYANADLGLLAIQLDTGQSFVLKTLSPIEWQDIGVGTLNNTVLTEAGGIVEDEAGEVVTVG